jgi:hypothetical protein
MVLFIRKTANFGFSKKIDCDETRREVKELSHHNYRKNIYSVEEIKIVESYNFFFFNNNCNHEIN